MDLDLDFVSSVPRRLLRGDDEWLWSVQRAGCVLGVLLLQVLRPAFPAGLAGLAAAHHWPPKKPWFMIGKARVAETMMMSTE